MKFSVFIKNLISVIFQLQPSLWLLILFTYYEAKVTQDELRKYLQTTYEKEVSERCFKSANAAFDFATDVKNKTKQDITVR